MDFVKLKKTEYEKFLIQHKQKTFLHTPMIGEMRNGSGWDYIFLGIKENNEIIAATMLLSRKSFLNKKEFYAIRGFLIDYNNLDVFTFFTEKIKKYAKKNGGFILRLDPYLSKQERDINGDIVENGTNNFQAIENLKKLGFKETNCEQAKWMFVLDTEQKTIDELYKQMKPNTRNCINKTFKTGIFVREISYKELNKFHKVIEETGERKKFVNKQIGYYQKMYNLFHKNNEIKFLVAELNTHEYLHNVEEEIKVRENKLHKISPTQKSAIEEEKISIASLQKKLEEAKKLAKEQKTVILSAAMFLLYGDEIVYLSGGSYQQYMHLYAQYRIQYEIIKYAAENHFKKYNFYGISGNFDKNDSRYGVYAFKKGFNGYVVELIGEYQISLDCFYYQLYNIIIKFKKIFKEVVRK